MNLTQFDDYEWMTSEENIWVVPSHPCDIPHRPLLTPAQVKKPLTRVDRRIIPGEIHRLLPRSLETGAPHLPPDLTLFFVHPYDFHVAPLQAERLRGDGIESTRNLATLADLKSRHGRRRRAIAITAHFPGIKSAFTKDSPASP